ncbi:metallophosphoesterase [Serratia sp. CY47279]|uniref:metallophosphoesterase n=1 Tax=Serratia sp. CY47279 TaxID=3383624 RepID=UPI003F9F44A6
MSERNGIYERIDGSRYRNIYVVGDIHGCYNLLMSQLDELAFDCLHDLLISVGDLIDRGPQNVECLDLITQPWFKAVRGNHEQMAIDALSGRGDVNMWCYNGGMWFFQLDYDQEILARALLSKAEFLPLIIEVVTPSGTVVVSHADYPSNEYAFGKPVPEEQIIWSRDRFNSIADGITGEITGADHFYFGHTPTRWPARSANQNYIDTGAVFGHALTIVQIQGEDNG